MTNVAGHLREQNGMYQMILSWKDTNGKRRTKSISTGLPVKGNKKRAESLLRKTQKEFNPETMQQVSDLPVSEYLNRWLRESVMNLPPETYGRYAYDLGRVVVPYFEKKRLSLKALSPRDLETFFRYERQQEEASVQQLLDWHKELTDALQYAVANNWLKVSPIKEVDPCLDNSPVLFTDFITDWLKMMKSRVEITTYTSYESEKIKIGVVDKDNGPLAEGLVKWFENTHHVTMLEDNREKLQEELFYRNIEYIVVIPEDFYESCMVNGESISVTKVPGSYSAYYVDQQLENCLNTMRTYLEAGFSKEEAAAAILDEKRGEVTMLDTDGNGSTPGWLYYCLLYTSDAADE